jgi:hypothetical protein
MAIDGSGAALQYTSGSWQLSTLSDATGTLWDLSCSGTTCVAVNLKGTAFVWNGSSWSTTALDATAPGVTAAVSCANSALCVADFGDGKVFVFNGAGWVNGPASPAGFPIDGLSCPTATSCMAVSGNYSMTLSAGVWSAPLLADGTGFLIFVRCVSGTGQCVSVDNHGQAVEFNGTAWSGPQQLFATDVNGFVNAIDVSCPALNTCHAVSGTDTVNSA